ncbi:MAG: hypothetical protein U1F77_11435 [Kiritimatiellia bacterium]
MSMFTLQGMLSVPATGSSVIRSTRIFPSASFSTTISVDGRITAFSNGRISSGTAPKGVKSGARMMKRDRECMCSFT